MASGHVNRANRAEHMAAPTKPWNVKKVLANPEPSTHGPKRWFAAPGACLSAVTHNTPPIRRCARLLPWLEGHP
jgi:hypothetical protein